MVLRWQKSDDGDSTVALWLFGHREQSVGIYLHCSGQHLKCMGLICCNSIKSKYASAEGIQNIMAVPDSPYFAVQFTFLNPGPSRFRGRAYRMAIHYIIYKKNISYYNS